MSDRANKEVGAESERLALAYLSKRGLRPLLRNYRCKGGELDLVMLDGETLALIEVRMRSSAKFGGAAVSVTPIKQRRIAFAARHLLMAHKELAQHRARFDVIAIDQDERGATKVEWIRDAFRV